MMTIAAKTSCHGHIAAEYRGRQCDDVDHDVDDEDTTYDDLTLLTTAIGIASTYYQMISAAIEIASIDYEIATAAIGIAMIIVWKPAEAPTRLSLASSVPMLLCPG